MLLKKRKRLWHCTEIMERCYKLHFQTLKSNLFFVSILQCHSLLKIAPLSLPLDVIFFLIL